MKTLKPPPALISLAIGLLALSSCRHRELCNHHGDDVITTSIFFQADYRHEWEIPAVTDRLPYSSWKQAWPSTLPMEYESLRPGEPEGLSVVVFPANSQNYRLNLPARGGEVYFKETGKHSLVLYNNDTEFIKFTGMESYASSKATTRGRNRASYYGNPYYTARAEEEVTVNPPDMIYGYYEPWLEVEDLLLSERPVIAVEMQPLVFTYVIEHTVEEGGEYIVQARGALAGMAQGVWLNSGTTTDDAVTILYDCVATGRSVIATVRSFGVPSWPKPDYGRASGQYALNLELRLQNGKVMRYDYDVTDQVRAQPRGGVIRVGGIKISEEEAITYGSGFQVDVTEWGEEEEIVM